MTLCISGSADGNFQTWDFLSVKELASHGFIAGIKSHENGKEALLQDILPFHRLRILGRP